MKKKIFSLLLMLCMVLSLLPVNVFAAEGEEQKPNAIFTVLNPVTLTEADHNYSCWPSGETSVDRPLQIVANFTTNDTYTTSAEAKEHPYSQYLVDFYLTVSGLVGDSITADNCYLAGEYGTYGWIVIPTDGQVIEDGKEYPVVSNYDATLKYEDICVAVQDFTAAIYIDETILESNPDMVVTLALKMTNPEDTSDVYVAGSYKWGAAALLKGKEIAGMSPEEQEFVLDLEEAEQEFALDLEEEDLDFLLELDESSQEIVLGIGAFNSEWGKTALELMESLQNTAQAEANAAAVENVEEVETLDVTLADVVMEEGSDVPTLVYEVNPLSATGEKVSNPSSAITFRLPVPDEIGNTYDYANVTHDGEPMGTYPILGEEGGYYVEVTSDTFSQFGVEPCEAGDEETYAAQIDGKDGGYDTLAAAISAAAAGDKIILLKDADENVTIDKNLTIDGANKNYTGTMTVNTSLTVTVENVNFVKGCIAEASGSHGNLTVKDCTFDGVDKSIGYAITVRGGDKLVIENSTAANYSTGMLYVPSPVAAISVKDVKAANVAAAFNITYSGDATFESVAFENVTYGIHFQIYGSRTYTVKNSDLSGATNPFWFWDKSNDTAKVTVVFEGNNTVPAFQSAETLENISAFKMAVGAELIAPEGLTITAVDADNYEVKYENGKYVAVEKPKTAMIDGKGQFETLQAAIDAAETGDTVKLLSNITLADADMVTTEDGKNVMLNVTGKDITLDLNEKVITVDYNGGQYLFAVVYVADGATLTVTGNGSIDVPENGINVAYMFWKRGTTGALTIENGTFHMDDAADSMVYTNGSEIVTVNGGTFTLDAIGTRTNGFPCIFSAAGQNQRNIIVTGGTFNADVNHQYWAHEVNVSETLAVKDNGDGTWTVVPAAAYITETAHGYTRKVGYATLADAINADNGHTVYLNGDLNIGNGITVGHNAAKVVTIDLNSFKLTGSGVTLTAFRSGTEVTLKNGTVHGNSSGGTLVTTYNGKLILGDDLTVTSGGQASAIKVNGGKLEVTGKNVKVTGGAKGCIILGSENDNNNITISGGTYSAEIPEEWCIEDYGSVKNTDGTYTVQRIKFVLNETTGEKYATIAEAIKAIPKGAEVQNLKLLDNTTAKGQFIGHTYAQNVVLDLNGFTLSSTDKTLTIYRSGTEVTIKNGTISGNTTGGTIQVTYGGKLTLGENVTVKSGGSANAIKVDANSTLVIANESVKVLGGKNDLIVAESAKVEIAAGSFKHPVEDAWCAEGKMPALEKTAEGYYTVMDACEAVIIRNDEIFYGTLTEAIAAAQNNETIKLMSDIAVTAEDAVDLDSYASIFNIDGKTVTIDMNGKTISCDAEGIEKMLIGVFTTDNNGHLTLTGSGTVQATANGANVYALITNYEDGCSITINNGTYELDEASDSLIYSGASANEGEADENGVYSGVIINGGTFKLGNVGTGKNYGPWIFNARGRNQRHVWVEAGTFNADINHQYWIFEVQMSKEKALQKGEDGMYTVVDAVCYVVQSHGNYFKEVGFASLDDAKALLESNIHHTNTYYKTIKAEEKLYDMDGNEIDPNANHVNASTQDALNEAVTGADAVVNVTLVDGSYTMPSTNGDITISGTKDTVISGNDATAKNVTFNGVTIQSTGIGYTGIKHSEKVVYNNVTIVGNMYLYAKEVVFENCTFDLSDTNDYIWVYGATNVTFKNCTFNTMGKAILVFQDGSQVDQTVTVEGCTFNASQAAYNWDRTIHIAAVSIDGSQGGTYKVILNNNTVDEKFDGLWQDKTNAGNISVTVDGNSVL